MPSFGLSQTGTVQKFPGDSETQKCSRDLSILSSALKKTEKKFLFLKKAQDFLKALNSAPPQYICADQNPDEAKNRTERLLFFTKFPKNL
ncbi:MAG TPA: hypothetical protein VFM02_04570 [Candidatus Paceibacterota bacterium]|nr:hypothetical protein [Candidatus Paceibacterota bacterium]